jgi:hypothetical protein
MANVSLFKNNPLANSDLFKSLLEQDKALRGSDGGFLRISLKGNKFRKMQGSNQLAVSKDDTMNVVILRSADISRTYFAGEYNPDEVVSPSCWSADTKTPSAQVPVESRQSDSCSTCPMNIKGSGQGDSRACRFNQKLAIALEDDLETVLGLQLPAASLFGATENGNMPMQAYAKFLHAHETPAIAIVTEIQFDEDSSVPKLFFKPVRPLSQEELETVLTKRDSKEAIDAVTMSVGAPAAPTTPAIAKPKPAAKPVVEEEEEEEEEEAPVPPKKAAVQKPAFIEDAEEAEVIEEPTKAPAKKSAMAEPTTDNLKSIIDGWDDE